MDEEHNLGFHTAIDVENINMSAMQASYNDFNSDFSIKQVLQILSKFKLFDIWSIVKVIL